MNLVKNIAVYSFSDVALKMISFMLIPLYTRVLSPDDYGLVGFANSVAALLSPLIGLNLTSTITPLYYAYADGDRKRLISSTVNFGVIYGLIATMVLSIICCFLLGKFNTKVTFYPYIILAISTSFFNSLYCLPMVLFNMQGRTVAYSLYSIGLSSVGVILNFIFIFIFRWGAVGLLLASFYSSAFGLLVVLFSLKGSYRFVLAWSDVVSVLKLAVPFVSYSFIGSVGRQIDRLLLAEFQGLSMTGTYYLANTISSVMLVFFGGATAALNPLFYKRANAGDKSLSDDWSRISKIFFFGMVWFGGGFAVLSPEIMVLMATPKYGAAIPCIQIMVISQVVTGLYWLFFPGIGLTKKVWAYTAASVPTLVLSCILNFLIVPRYGDVGAAWVGVIASVVQTSIFGFFSLKNYYFRVAYGQFCKVVLVVSVAYYLGGLLVFQSLLFTITLKILLLLMVPLVLLILGFFSKEDFRVMRAWK